MSTIKIKNALLLSAGDDYLIPFTFIESDAGETFWKVYGECAHGPLAVTRKTFLSKMLKDKEDEFLQNTEEEIHQYAKQKEILGIEKLLGCYTYEDGSKISFLVHYTKSTENNMKSRMKFEFDKSEDLYQVLLQKDISNVVFKFDKEQNIVCASNEFHKYYQYEIRLEKEKNLTFHRQSKVLSWSQSYKKSLGITDPALLCASPEGKRAFLSCKPLYQMVSRYVHPRDYITLMEYAFVNTSDDKLAKLVENVFHLYFTKMYENKWNVSKSIGEVQDPIASTAIIMAHRWLRGTCANKQLMEAIEKLL